MTRLPLWCIIYVCIYVLSPGSIFPNLIYEGRYQCPLVEKLFGSFSDRELKKINPLTKQVLALEEKYAAMPDADLQAQTAVFKQQLADGKTTE